MIFQKLKQWFFKRKLLFYIGRHDVLKEPLKGKDEKIILRVCLISLLSGIYPHFRKMLSAPDLPEAY